jgi:hypothetical protein
LPNITAAEGAEKEEMPQRIVAVPVMIRKGHLPNTSQLSQYETTGKSETTQNSDK